jgi:uncharacterized protein (TIGR01777 family)
MHVLLSGSSGLVGAAFRQRLLSRGDEVVRLFRSTSVPTDAIRWDPYSGPDKQALADRGPLDAVVHLAGESIASGRWTAARRARIRESRVAGTRGLCEALASSPNKPAVIVSASAIGYYGDRGDEVLSESSAAGSGFLAEVCRAWEAACEPARAAGIRVVSLRLGMVLASPGGALEKMLPPFRFGLGGRLGSGEQWMSWITLGDLLAVLDHVVTSSALSGPVNAVAPGATTNAEFTRVLGRVLGRPTLLPVPAFGLRLLLGQMADELLLASTRVIPGELLASGFEFDQPELEGALSQVLRGKK